MSTKTEEAKIIFSKGFNCAQSVLSVFAPEVGLKSEDALRVSGAFGAGMGCMGEVCGAVTGAFMAIGLHSAKTKPGEDDKKLRGYQMVTEFTRLFCHKHQTIQCRTLIGLDLSTEEGMATAVAENRFHTHCAMYVNGAVEILESMLKLSEKKK
ncbi:MAG: C_GCAxxG_C_C family protein [Deltaproteobacteria bacterium]|nr:C_GCAxxG_C_C family protein [Deltaproteobacteria bacterium]MBN2672091.1 C_GCAxxG_C_C family protein [Deltaproteobacteria bacterium]